MASSEPLRPAEVVAVTSGLRSGRLKISISCGLGGSFYLLVHPFGKVGLTRFLKICSLREHAEVALSGAQGVCVDDRSVCHPDPSLRKDLPPQVLQQIVVPC